MPGSPRILAVGQDKNALGMIKAATVNCGWKSVEQAYTVPDASKLLREENFDLVIVSAGIKRRLDGIELGEMLDRDYKIPFIYLCSEYDEAFLKQAYPTHPSGYLELPFTDQDFEYTVRLALYKSKNKYQAHDGESLNLLVKHKSSMVPLEASRVAFVKANESYSVFHTPIHQYTVAHSLRKVESKLLSRGFVKISGDCLVNLHFVDRVVEDTLFVRETELKMKEKHLESVFSLLS